MEKLRPLFDTDLKKSITDIMSESSKLKKDVFKTLIMKNDLDMKNIKMYMGSVNDFLRFWDDYSKALQENMKKSKGKEGIKSLEYSYIKDWIYGKFDYASILPFTDGIVKGIESGKFESVEDIEEFRNHTISKAFDDHASNVAGLIDEVTGTWDWNGNGNIATVTKHDAHMFDSVKSYDMFNGKSRSVLYKAIDKVVEYITMDLKNKKSVNKDTKLLISIINNIVDYMSYSLAAFACRIYVIGTYAIPFLNNNDDKVDDDRDIEESYKYEDNEYFDEKSQRTLKSCYRIGFDINTGRQVAIQFKLEPEKITYVGSEGLYHAAHNENKKQNFERLQDVQDQALDYVKKNIRKKGHIDFRTDEGLMVEKIFYKDGRSTNSVSFIPIYAKELINAIDSFRFSYRKEMEANNLKNVNDILDSEIFGNYLKKYIENHKFDIEHYVVGKVGGENKYKSTKVLWGHRAIQYRFTPMLRGYNKPQQGTDTGLLKYNGINRPGKKEKNVWEAPKQLREIRHYRDINKLKKRFQEMKKNKRLISSGHAEQSTDKINSKCNYEVPFIVDEEFMKQREWSSVSDFNDGIDLINWEIKYHKQSAKEEIAEMQKEKEEKPAVHQFRHAASDLKAESYDDILTMMAYYEVKRVEDEESREVEDYQKPDDKQEVHKDGITTRDEYDSVDMSILRSADDRLCKDMANIKEYFDTFAEFTKACGADSTFEGKKPTYQNSYMSPTIEDTNAFCSKLLANPIHEYMFKTRYDVVPYNATDKQIDELYQVMKSFVYNTNHGLEGASTPKQEILHVIRGTTLGDSLEKQKELARDLYVCALHFLCNIERFVKEITDWINRPEGSQRTVTTRHNATEVLRMLSDLYRELATAFYQKGRDIEVQIQRSTKKSVDKILDTCTLKVPGGKQADERDSANISMSVPDTLRQPTDMMDLYSLPAFESLMMWDDYLKELPEFTESAYFTEASVIGNIFNALIAKIVGAFNYIKNFIDDKNTQKAIDWVKKNANNLRTMNLRGCEIDVVNYKAKLELPKGFENLVNNLKKTDGILDSKENLDKWIVSLYPNPDVYKWFNTTNEEELKKARRKYRNWFLFQDWNANMTEEELEKKVIKIGDSQVAKNLSAWIDNIVNLNDIKKQFSDIQSNAKKAVETLKTELDKKANEVKNESTEIDTGVNWRSLFEDTYDPMGQASGKPTVTPSNTESGKKTYDPTGSAGKGPSVSDTSKEEGKQETPNINSGETLASKAMTAAYKAVNEICNPLGRMVVEYILAEYKYLQQAYNHVNSKK